MAPAPVQRSTSAQSDTAACESALARLQSVGSACPRSRWRCRADQGRGRARRFARHRLARLAGRRRGSPPRQGRRPHVNARACRAISDPRSQRSPRARRPFPRSDSTGSSGAGRRSPTPSSSAPPSGASTSSACSQNRSTSSGSNCVPLPLARDTDRRFDATCAMKHLHDVGELYYADGQTDLAPDNSPGIALAVPALEELLQSTPAPRH